MSVGTLEIRSPIHRLRLVASFALLGAVVAGAASIVPGVGALLPAVMDLHLIGAAIGGVAGTAVQVIHQ